VFANGLGLDHKVIADETFLQACIKEAIRMHPPIIFLMRRALVDIELPYLPGKVIPKGNMIMVSNAVAQRMPEVFDRPSWFFSYAPFLRTHTYIYMRVLTKSMWWLRGLFRRLLAGSLDLI